MYRVYCMMTCAIPSYTRRQAISGCGGGIEMVPAAGLTVVPWFSSFAVASSAACPGMAGDLQVGG